MTEELQAEYGSTGNIRFGGMNVTVTDSAGAEIEMVCGQCGSKKDVTFFQGKESFAIRCYECLYGQPWQAKFIYRPPND